MAKVREMGAGICEKVNVIFILLYQELAELVDFSLRAASIVFCLASFIL